MEYILDTNICIYIIKRKPVQVFDRLLTIPVGSVAISSITLAELHYGIAKSSNPEKNRDALDMFLIPLEILEFDSRAANEYGHIRADLERKGKIIGPLDMLIADLRVENWI